MKLYTDEEIKTEHLSLLDVLRTGREEPIGIMYSQLQRLKGMSLAEIENFYGPFIYRTVHQIIRCNPKELKSLRNLAYDLHEAKWLTLRLIGLYRLQNEIIKAYNFFAKIKTDEIQAEALKINNRNEDYYHRRKKVSKFISMFAGFYFLIALFNAFFPHVFLGMGVFIGVIAICKLLTTIEQVYKPQEFSPKILETTQVTNWPELIWNKNKLTPYEQTTVYIMIITLVLNFGNLIRYFL